MIEKIIDLFWGLMKIFTKTPEQQSIDALNKTEQATAKSEETNDTSDIESQFK